MPCKSIAIEDKGLRYTLVRRDDLNPTDIRRMLQLMQAHYSHVTESMFLNDLAGKQYVGLIRDQNQQCQGFTTFVIDPLQCAGEDYHIIFSGDTIIDENYWGTQIMMKGWCMSAGAIVASDRTKPWYWYLMSKGHRTYMYLPLFFRDFYPCVYQQQGSDELFKIADEVSFKLFNDAWKRDEGIIRFEDHHGALNEELASAAFKKESNRHVKFFLEKNPEFHAGNELVCIADLSEQNLMRSARLFFIEGKEMYLP